MISVIANLQRLKVPPFTLTDASPDASSTSFIPPEYIPVPAGLDALLFSFRVVNGLVEPSAGAQFRNTKEVNEKATDYQSIGPFPIQLGAGATGDGAQGPPPQVIQFGVQRGADTGTGVLGKSLQHPFAKAHWLINAQL